jgi:energy-converting hydrogenase Eha subunit E
MEARQTRPPAGAAYSGWIAFAGVMMVILGSLDALWGLAAILNDEVVVVGGNGALIFDITTWGWVHLILGLAVALTGVGLITGNSAARVAGIFFVAVNAIAQIVWFPAAPLWAFLLIVLDTVIIYQLTVNWSADEARR